MKTKDKQFLMQPEELYVGERDSSQPTKFGKITFWVIIISSVGYFGGHYIWYLIRNYFGY